MPLQLEHLDGHKVQVGTGGVTRPGEVRWFQGEGMPRFEKVGGGLRGEGAACVCLMPLVAGLATGLYCTAQVMGGPPSHDFVASSAVPGAPPSPMQSGRGDLWVTFNIAFPKSVTDEQRAELKRLFGGEPQWQRRELAHDEL